MKKHSWIWILIFVVVVVLLGVLAAGWNFVYLERAREFELHSLTPSRAWVGMVFGSLGFVGLLGGMVLFFIKLLREMRLNQLQSEFIATVSHELKTPLATLELSSSLLRSQSLTPEETESLWASHQAELKRLNIEVDALLEAAQWQSDGIKSERVRVRLEDWLVHSLSRWHSILGPGSELERVGDPLHCDIWVDPKLLNRIVDNLIDNARKFAMGRPSVMLSSRLVDGKWQLAVQDSGWGFHTHDSKRIFQRFVRGQSDAPYAIPGTGLGLYLASTACRSMGIQLTAQSAGQGKGARFQLEGMTS